MQGLNWFEFVNDSLTGEKERRKNLNNFTEALIQVAADEEKGAYRPYYQALRAFEKENLAVLERQIRLFHEDEEPLEYAIANLMFQAHASFLYPNPPTYSRKEMLESARVVLSVPTGHACLVSLVVANFPQAVFSAEYLYFKNRTVTRMFEFDEKDRPVALQGEDPKDWILPTDHIDALREMALDLWVKERESRRDN